VKKLDIAWFAISNVLSNFPNPSFAPSSKSTRITLSRTEKLQNVSVDEGIVALNRNQSSLVFIGLLGTTELRVG